MASPALQEEQISFAMPLQADVPALARRGVSWSVVLLAGRYVVSVTSTAALARLLSPSDYGLMGMVATFTVLVQAISDFGLSWATVQRVELSRKQIDGLFFINSAFGLVLMAACAGAAPYVAAFYHRPELTRITIGVSGALFLSTIAVQPSALMRRQMKLKELSLCSLWGLLISAVVAVVLARMGFGYRALVIQLVLQQAIITGLSFPFSGYYPRLPLDFLNLGSLLTFGGYSTAYGLVNYFARNLDNVLVGKYWGATELGYYSRAYFLMTVPGMLVISVFSGVLIPAMASLRNDRERMQSAYLRALRLIAVLGCSFAVGLAVAAPEIVELIYGPRWRAVVPILLWLSIAGILQPIQNTAQWLYIVAERGRGMFGMGLIVSVSAVIAFALGIPHGGVGVARAYAIANTLIAYPTLFMAHRASGLSMKKTLAESTPLLISALIMGLAVWVIGIEVAAVGLPIYGRLGVKVAAGLAVYGFSLRQLSPATYREILGSISR